MEQDTQLEISYVITRGIQHVFFFIVKLWQVNLEYGGLPQSR